MMYLFSYTGISTKIINMKLDTVYNMVYFFKLAWNHSPRSTWVIHMKIGNVGKHSNRIGCTLLQGLFLLVYYYCTNHTYLAPKAE